PQPGVTPNAGTSADIPGQSSGVSVPGIGGAPAAATRESAIAASNRIVIDTPRIGGTINLTGGRIDDLILKDYRVTVEPGSPNIELLNPSVRPDGYFAEVGFVGNATTGEVPGPGTVWSVEGQQTLTPSTPVKLTFT